MHYMIFIINKIIRLPFKKENGRRACKGWRRWKKRSIFVLSRTEIQQINMFSNVAKVIVIVLRDEPLIEK